MSIVVRVSCDERARRSRAPTQGRMRQVGPALRANRKVGATLHGALNARRSCVPTTCYRLEAGAASDCHNRHVEFAHARIATFTVT